MGFHILMDSVGDVTEELTGSPLLTVIPLTLHINGESFEDDGTYSQAEILQKIAACKDCPKSSCPAPGIYLDEMEKHLGERIYVITSSANLSGSHGSAMLGLALFQEKHPDEEAYVINSRSACAGEPMIAHKLIEFEEQQLAFHEVCARIEEFISKMETVFVLEDLSFLLLNGRLTGLKAIFAEALHIVPVLQATREGEITQYSQARGARKALQKLLAKVTDDLEKHPRTQLTISHCNAPEAAERVAHILTAAFPELKVNIAPTGGVATLYAGDKGLVFAY